MRILHVDTGRAMRGGQWQVLELMKGLRERGIVQLLAAPAGSPLFQKAGESGFDVIPVSWSAIGGGAIIHAHDSRAHTLAVLKFVQPLVVSRRVAFPAGRGPLSRWKYSRPRLFLAVSRFVAGRLREAGVEERRIRVVYDGVPELPQAAGFRVVAPATGDPEKGSDLVREAARLAGIDVHFSADLIPDLATARVLVYISREEGLGSAALLAQSAGVPVIASNIGGLREAVLNGETGLLVENSVPEIAAAMRLLIDDARVCMRMAEAGRARVREKFSAARMVEDSVAAYQDAELGAQ
jgi:hypothetical protein